MCGMPPRLVCVGAKSASHAAAQTRSARGCALRVDHAEAQTFLEDIEVTIAMEQRVLLADAVGCRQHIDGLTNRRRLSSTAARLVGAPDRRIARLSTRHRCRCWS